MNKIDWFNCHYLGSNGNWILKHSESKLAWNVINSSFGEKYKIARCPYIQDDALSDDNNTYYRNVAKHDATLISNSRIMLDIMLKMIQASYIPNVSIANHHYKHISSVAKKICLNMDVFENDKNVLKTETLKKQTKANKCEPKNKIFYISGKITGLPIDEARKMFNEAQSEITNKFHGSGFINPTGMFLGADGDYEEYMRMDLELLERYANSIYMLKNYKDSDGALRELKRAKQLGYHIEYQ